MTFAQLWRRLRRVDRFLTVEAQHEKLDARADMVVAARAAAASFLSDVARRVGVLDAMAGRSGPRLAPT